MNRVFVIGALSLSLAACGGRYVPVKVTPRPADLPDPQLVEPCDQRNTDPATNAALADELAVARDQRDRCAAKVDGMRQWRSDAAKRADPNVGT